MSLFSWFLRKTASLPAPARHAQSPSASVRNTATAPYTTATTPEVALRHRNERMERRELLYTVVRDAMVRAGVLSASYKFKVLALDQRGLQFLVMMDLAREYGGETVRLSDIEGLISQTAKTRHGIAVTAVYWRIDDHISAALAKRSVAPHRAAVQPLAAVLATPPRSGAAAELAARPPAAPSAPNLKTTRNGTRTDTRKEPALRSAEPLVAPRFDPIGAEEVAAFKRALASATTVRAPAAATSASGPRSTGAADSQFPDTEMPQEYGQRTRSSSLSNTQYGDL